MKGTILMTKSFETYIADALLSLTDEECDSLDRSTRSDAPTEDCDWLALDLDSPDEDEMEEEEAFDEEVEDEVEEGE